MYLVSGVSFLLLFLPFFVFLQSGGFQGIGYQPGGQQSAGFQNSQPAYRAVGSLIPVDSNRLDSTVNESFNRKKVKNTIDFYRLTF